MASEKLYLVMGDADDVAWAVAWYRLEDKAVEHVAKANARSRELYQQFEMNPRRIPLGSNEWDADMFSTEERSEYYYLEVEHGKGEEME